MAAEPEWVVPAGAPIRMYEWLTPPLLALGLGLFLAFIPITRSRDVPPPFSIVAVAVLSAAALALWIFGYLAYRDLTEHAVDHYFMAIAISVFAAGVLLSFGNTGWLLLVAAGHLAAGRKPRPIRLVRTIMPRRRWRRTAVIAAIVAAVCLLLSPLAYGLGFAPLVILVVVGRVVAPVVFGFALRSRVDAAGIF